MGQIDAFVEDASAASARAVALDTKIMTDAAKISPEYVDLVSIATRQILGSLDITVLGDVQDGVNASDVKIFVKNMGADQCVLSTAPFCFHLTLFSTVQTR